MDYKDIQMIWDEQNAKAIYGYDSEVFEKHVIEKKEKLISISLSIYER